MLHRKLCKTVGCGNLTYDRSGFCDRCRANYHRERAPEDKTTEKWQTRKISYLKGYGTGRWKAFSRQFLLDHPNCERCGARAEVCDHKVMTAFQMVDAYGCFLYEPEYYQALCYSCNNKKRKADAESDKEYLRLKGELDCLTPGGGVETF